ncbi:MAG: ABC transporter substrate-binding protein [bacterium]
MIFLITLIFATNTFCQTQSSQAQAQPQGQTHPSRIAALSPAIVTTLVDIGLEEKIACAAGPLEDIKLSNSVQSLGMYHKPNIELIIKCKPDLVISTFAGTPPAIHKKLKDLGYNMMLEKPDTLASIKTFILKMSKMFNIKEPSITKEFDNICTDKTSKTALMIVGLNPIFAAGSNSFVSDAIRCAGYKNLLSGGYKRLSIEKIISLNPDFLIIGMNKPESVREYKMLKDVFKDRILVLDPSYILEPSSRILKGIKELKEINHKKE